MLRIGTGELERVMVFGAHPDDEIIGPGGVLHRLSREGAQVCVVTFTCGETAADSPEAMQAMARARRQEMQQADGLLGVAERHVLAVPSQQVYGAVYGDNRLHHELIRLLRTFRPQALLAHAPDAHRDHCAVAQIAPQAAFQAAEDILQHLGAPWRTAALLRYGVEQELPEANVVVRTAPQDLEAQLQALRTQLSQARRDYLVRCEQMVRARAELWGAKAFGPGELAQAFYLDGAYLLKVA